MIFLVSFLRVYFRCRLTLTLLVVIGHVITLVYCIYFQPEDEVSYFETSHLRLVFYFAMKFTVLIIVLKFILLISGKAILSVSFTNTNRNFNKQLLD